MSDTTETVQAVKAEIKEYTPAGGPRVMVWVNDRMVMKDGYCIDCVPRHVAPIIIAALTAAPAPAAVGPVGDVASMVARLRRYSQFDSHPRALDMVAACDHIAALTKRAEKAAREWDAYAAKQAEAYFDEREKRLAAEASLAAATEDNAKLIAEAVAAEREACAALAARVINDMRGSGESDLRSARARVEHAIRARSHPGGSND